MTQTIAAAKEKVIANCENGVAGAPPCSCDPANCQPCRRVDLQFLVVTPSVVPKEHETVLKDAGYAWAPSFDAEFGSMKREATIPVARISRAGFIPVYYPHRKRWDIWQVMANGLTRKVMHQVNTQQYSEMQSSFNNAPEPKTCSRGAANLPAQLISIEGGIDIAEIWLTYTEHLWLPSVLQQFADNAPATVTDPNGKPIKKPLRELHGRTFSPSGILTGASFPSGCLPFNAAALQNAVADFAKEASRKLHKAFELSLRPLDKERFGQAEAFEKQVRAIERASGPKNNPELYLNKSLIVMVEDDVGVVEQHNTLRLAAQEAKKLWAAGGPGIAQAADPTRVWALRSSVHLETIEQWEAASAAQVIITKQTDEIMHRRYGASVTKEAFDARQANAGYPPGTTWEPLYEMDGNQRKLDARGYETLQWSPSLKTAGAWTQRGRIRLPDEMVKAAAIKNGAGEARGMQGRLQGRVDMQQVSFFRSEFKAESERWDKRIGEFDRDFLAWRNGKQFGATYRHHFDHSINLTNPDLKLGSAAQQAADFAARLSALDKAMGGGAITIDSAKALAAFHGQQPDKPESWIDNAFYKVFDLKKETLGDPGNRSEAGESAAGLKAIHKTARNALAKQLQHHHLERTLSSLLATRSQITNILASAIDKKTAEALGIAAVSAEEARKAMRVHIRVNLLAEELVNVHPTANVRKQYVFNMKIPVGVALDEVRNAMSQGVLPMSFQPKNETSRAERRYTGDQFRKLDGRINTEMNYPVLLDTQMLEKLQKQALASGEGLIEILPDAHLGMASGPVKVPQNVARRLIREQAVSARKALTETGEGKVLGAVAAVQFFALLDTALKIGKKEGIEQADAVLSTVSTVLAMVETRNTFKLHLYTLRADGARTLTVKTATSLARLRLGAGLFGAAASALDSTLAFVRAGNAGRAGDTTTARAYYVAGGLYGVSAVLSTVGSVATYMSFTGPLGAGAGAAVLGAWLMGVGIVLAIGAYGFMLYALYTVYQSADIFLDRSYWGNGKRVEGKFGLSTRKQLQEIRDNKQLSMESRVVSLKQIVSAGMRAEVESFNALPVGLQITFEWNRNWFSDEAVVLKVACGEWPSKRNISVKIELLAGTGVPNVVVLEENGLMLAASRNEEKLLEWAKPWVFKNGSHMQYPMARVTYNIYGDNERDILTRDTLLVSRGG